MFTSKAFHGENFTEFSGVWVGEREAKTFPPSFRLFFEITFLLLINQLNFHGPLHIAVCTHRDTKKPTLGFFPNPI